MGLLKKLFGGNDEDREQAAHDAERKAFLEPGSRAPGPPTPGGDRESPVRNAGDEAAVIDEDVAAAFGAEVVGRETAIDDGDVVNVDFRLRGSLPQSVSVFVCNHSGRPGMAADDESCWRDTGVERELSGLGDSAFVNKDGTLFARLGDRYTIQILPGGPTALDDEVVAGSRALARRILDRLEP